MPRSFGVFTMAPLFWRREVKPLDLYLFPDTLQVLLHVLYAEGNALRYTIDITKPEGSRIATLTY